jgi:hypothetical protein
MIDSDENFEDTKKLALLKNKNHKMKKLTIIANDDG